MAVNNIWQNYAFQIAIELKRASKRECFPTTTRRVFYKVIYDSDFVKAGNK